MTRHVHADCIIAWANGAEIEVFCPTNKYWIQAPAPTWSLKSDYRVKPRIAYTFLHETGCMGFVPNNFETANIKATLNEKGRILSIELIKNDT